MVDPVPREDFLDQVSRLLMGAREVVADRGYAYANLFGGAVPSLDAVSVPGALKVVLNVPGRIVNATVFQRQLFIAALEYFEDAIKDHADALGGSDYTVTEKVQFLFGQAALAVWHTRQQLREQRQTNLRQRLFQLRKWRRS